MLISSMDVVLARKFPFISLCLRASPWIPQKEPAKSKIACYKTRGITCWVEEKA